MAEGSESRRQDSTAQASDAGGSRDVSRDTLLEIFRNTEVGENPISLLSLDLADIDIHSLLEQSRRIARQIRAR